MSQMVRLLFLILVSIACAVETRAVTAPSKSAKNVQGSASTPVSHAAATTGPVKVTPVPMSLQELDTHIMPAGAPPDRRSVLSVVYNGYRRSSLEPCGCVSHKLGGIDREAQVVERLKALSLPVVKLEAGGYIRDNALASENFRVASKHLLKALAALDYDVLNVGAPDALAGKAFLAENLGKHADRLVSANIVDPTSSAPLFSKYRIIEVKLGDGTQVRIGVTGVTRQRIGVSPQAPTFQVLDPLPAIKEVVKELQGNCDFIILLAYMNRETLRQTLEQLGPDPGIDVAIAGEFLGVFHQIDNVNGVRMVSGGFEGRHVGHLLLQMQNGKIAQALNKLVDIEQTIPPHPDYSHFITDYLKELTDSQQPVN